MIRNELAKILGKEVEVNSLGSRSLIAAWKLRSTLNILLLSPFHIFHPRNPPPSRIDRSIYKILALKLGDI